MVVGGQDRAQISSVKASWNALVSACSAETLA